MKTWGAFKLEIGGKINNPRVTKPALAASLLNNANDALRLLAAQHTGCASTFTITGDGSTTQYSLPTNCLDNESSGVYAVYDALAGVWMKQVTFFPGEALGLGYYVWPSGSINFYPAPSDGYDINVYYVAYYDEIVDDNSNIAIPVWAYEAIKLYTAGRTLEDQASQMALLGQFKTKVDSGGPEDQPIMRLSERYIQQFWEILNSYPAPQYDRMSR
jgi:hypothetical protein